MGVAIVSREGEARIREGVGRAVRRVQRGGVGVGRVQERIVWVWEVHVAVWGVMVTWCGVGEVQEGVWEGEGKGKEVEGGRGVEVAVIVAIGEGEG